MTREDINDIINAICPNDEDYEKPCISPKYLRQELEQLALDQKQWNGEPTTKNDLVVDAVSRQEVLYLIADDDLSMGQVVRGIHALPPVTPQEPRKGHWIMTHDYFTGAYENIDYVKCSCCGEDSLEYGNYCPNCGAEMNEAEE